jgi:glutaredoxin
MTAEELDRVRAAAAGLAADVALVVRRGPDAEQNGRVEGFAKDVCGLSPRLSATIAEEVDPEGASLGLALGARVPVRFRAVPEGLELGVFLSALKHLSAPPPKYLQGAPLALAAPLSAEVMTLPACAHCPAVAEALCHLAIASDRLEAHVIDLHQAPQFIDRHGLTHTPVVIVNGHAFIKARKADELAAELAAVAAGEHERFILAARLEAGEAAAVAKVCLDSGRLTPGLCGLVAAEAFQTRLGAMVALQEIARQNPELAAQAVAEVAALLKDADPRNRGDAAYLLGELGRREALPHLEGLLADPDASVVEAAREALEELKAISA